MFPLILFAAPIIGQLAAMTSKLSLRGFTGVYGLLTATIMMISYIYGTLNDLLIILGISVGVFVIAIILIGLLGEKISQVGVKSFIVALGLFPYLVAGEVSYWFYFAIIVAGIISSLLLSLRKGNTAVFRRWTGGKRGFRDTSTDKRKITLLSPVFGFVAAVVALIVAL